MFCRHALIGSTEAGFRPTGIKVEAGDTINFFNGTGTMQPWPSGPVFGPNGDDRGDGINYKWDGSLFPDEFFCKLVGRIRDYSNNTQTFGIGTGTNITATISGEIFLGINDGVSWADNQGPGFSINITLPQENFLLIPPSKPLGVLSGSVFILSRNYAAHQIEQPAQLGVDYTILQDAPSFGDGNYTDPVSRISSNFQNRRVTSMAPGIIINVFREELTVGVNNANPLWPGEDRGITVEILTWYPYGDPNPQSYYLIQYTHIFPTFGVWGALNFPSIADQISNNTIATTRANGYASLPINTRNNNVAFGPLISSGGELGSYAMIGLSSVGPHLHISMAKFDQAGSLPSIVNGRPAFGAGTPFSNWLANPFSTSQFDPEIFVPGATYV